jgi:hypothetical protein
MIIENFICISSRAFPFWLLRRRILGTGQNRIELEFWGQARKKKEDQKEGQNE